MALLTQQASESEDASALPAGDMEAMLRACLDEVSHAMLIVTPDLGVRLANRAARALAQVGDGILLADGRLDFPDRRMGQQLVRAINAVHVRPVPGSLAVRIGRRRSPQDLLAVVALLGQPGEQLFCVSIFDIEARQIPRRILADLYGLTPAEALLAGHLFRGLSLEGAATCLDITINTAKGQLKHVFEKCGVRSQAELLQLLALGPRQL